MSGSGRRKSRGSSQTQQTAPQSGTKGASTGTGGGFGSSDPCAIAFDVNLSGVNVAVAAGISVGTTLQVVLTVSNGFDVVVCQTAAGQVVGSLAAFPGLATLVGCLRSGRRYIAQVTVLNGTIVTVHVELAP